MSAGTMKLDTPQLAISAQNDKPNKVLIIKKCKISRKKSNVVLDKDALSADYGMGCESKANSDISDDQNPITLVENDSSRKSRVKKSHTKHQDKMVSKSDRVHERLEQMLSNSTKEKISSVLNDIRSLSDIEKLYLYLQLPTGASSETDPLKSKLVNPLGKKADDEGQVAVTWIKSHLEEDPKVSLPKQEVYDEYHAYCQMTHNEPLCAADFGKVMKQVFPSVKPRRLGTRGNSRYCYSGLKKQMNLKPPTLPDIQADIETTDVQQDEDAKDETASAACHILFDWAEKLLGQRFSTLKGLASHLLENMYVDNRSVAAFTLLLDGSPQLLEKGFSAYEGGVKRTDAQVHLQRKIQEKELIKEQKAKLQEMHHGVCMQNKGKASTKRKTSKSKKKALTRQNLLETHMVNTQSQEDTSAKLESEPTSEPLYEIQIKEENQNADSTSLLFDSTFDIADVSPSTEILLPASESTTPQSSPSKCSDAEDSAKSGTILISRSKTPVCIAQSISNIIIVPSVTQLTEVGKQTSPPSKYKKIQPKPEIFNAALRGRTGSVGSACLAKPKKRNDGRRSSHACLQSSYNAEGGADVPETTVVYSLTSPKCRSRKSSVVSFDASSKMESVLHSPMKTPQKTSAVYDQILKQYADSELVGDAGFTGKLVDGLQAQKRHIEGHHEPSARKKLHLDTGQECRVIWGKKASDEVHGFGLPHTAKQPSENLKDEFSIHEIEGDALQDYFKGSSAQLSDFGAFQIKESKDLQLQTQHISVLGEATKVSQLRMLLQQNLPQRTLSSTVKEKDVVSASADNNTPLPQLVRVGNISCDRNILAALLESTKQPKSLTQAEMVSMASDSDKLSRALSLAESPDAFAPNSSALGLSSDESSKFLSNPGIFLNAANSDTQVHMDAINQNSYSEIGPDEELKSMLSSSVIPLVGSLPLQVNSPVHCRRVNTCTQVPSVPQSPNTRTRAFNFTPISPLDTPGMDSYPSNISSPIQGMYPRSMMSVAVGPSQPPSNAGSPFVSPRSTPVSLCRSRHSSGQSSYSTSRHTPFQSADSGISSVTTSPFISPQPTPIPGSRLRHNSSTHATGKTVTFCSVGNPQIIPNYSATSQLRSRHSSGPHHFAGILSKNCPLSPLVMDPNNFVFPVVNESRSRHDSGSNPTSLSPVSEYASSSSSCTSNLLDASGVVEVGHQSFLNDAAGDLLLNGNSSFKQVRQRHASSSVIYNKSAQYALSPEIQYLLKNCSQQANPMFSGGHRSQSVPLSRMLQNLEAYPEQQQQHPSLEDSAEFKPQLDWDLEMGSSAVEPPLSDDLQTTLEDLRDCDTDFSKFAQELEMGHADGNL